MHKILLAVKRIFNTFITDLFIDSNLCHLNLLRNSSFIYIGFTLITLLFEFYFCRNILPYAF